MTDRVRQIGATGANIVSSAAASAVDEAVPSAAVGVVVPTATADMALPAGKTDVGVAATVAAGADQRARPRPASSAIRVTQPHAAAVAQPATTRLACGTSTCLELRAEMHHFLDGLDIAEIPDGPGKAEAQRAQRAAELDCVGINAAWARRFVELPNIEEPDLRHQLRQWRNAIAEHGRREAGSTAESLLETPYGAGPPPIAFRPPSMVAPTLDRARIATPGKLSTADSTSIHKDLRALGYATGARGAAGAWDADAFEGYKDFVERAVRAGKLTAEQATSANAASRGAVRALLRSAARTPNADADMRATPAQATMNSTVAPETKLVRVNKRWVRRPSGHTNKPEDVRLVQQALIARGFHVDPAKMGTYDATTQQAVQLYNATYRGLHARAGGLSTLVPGAMMTRSLFGNPEETPHLVDGPRWGELQDDPSIGLRTYHTPGSYVTPWGTQRARDFAIDFARNLRTIRPDSEILANDISLREGGPHPFHSGHEVGLELDFTHPDQAEGQTREQWLEERKQELLAMVPFNDRIALIYSSNPELVTYGRGIGLNMIQIGGHRMHYHVGIRGWTGELNRS